MGRQRMIGIAMLTKALSPTRPWLVRLARYSKLNLLNRRMISVPISEQQDNNPVPISEQQDIVVTMEAGKTGCRPGVKRIEKHSHAGIYVSGSQGLEIESYCGVAHRGVPDCLAWIQLISVYSSRAANSPTFIQ